MKHLLLSLLALATMSAAAAAQTTNIAELFGPDTVAYVEVVKPAMIANEIDPFIKGSVFEDMPAFLSKYRDRSPERWWFAGEDLGMLATFVGPEMRGEFARFKGGAIAITGFKRGTEPDIVGILLTGESYLPGFALRAYLSSAPMVRSAGKVEGVSIYRDAEGDRGIAIGPNRAPIPPPPPAAPPDQTYYVQLPGAVLIGTSMEGVSDVIRRYVGKEKRLSLAGAPGFKEAVALHERPGVFAFVNTARAAELLDTLSKGASQGPTWLQLVKDVINPKAFNGLAVSLGVENGHLDLRLQTHAVPGQSSALLDLFSDAAIDMKTLQHVPGDAQVVVSVPLADGEQKFRRLLALADGFMKGQGEVGATPSEMVKEIESKLKLSVAKELFGRLSGVTLVMPAKVELPKGGSAIPMVVVQTKSTADASKLETLVPKLLGALAGEPIDPITETVQGQKLRSLPAASLPWKTPLHYGHREALLVFGQDRKVVAAMLGGSAKDNLLADPKRAEVLQAHQQSALLALWQWGSMLPDLLPNPQARRFKPPGGAQPDQTKINEAAAKMRKALADVTKSMPPVIASIRRKDNRLEVSVRLSNARAAAPKLIDGIAKYLIEGGETMYKLEMGTPANPIPVPKN